MKNNTDKSIRYLRSRISQLKDDLELASDDHDKMWYKRCIQELNWALQMHDEPTYNCYMEEDELIRKAGAW